MGDGEETFESGDGTAAAPPGPSGPSFSWAQFPWANHAYGVHSFDVAYTLLNDGLQAGVACCHVTVSLEGEIVHVEDRRSAAVPPGHTWDDHFSVPTGDAMLVYDVDLHVTSPDNPEAQATARIKSDHSEGY